MSDELEKGLLEVQNLIHKQINQIKGLREECLNLPNIDSQFTRKTLVMFYDIMADFYMNMESMYINNEAQARQIDAVKDAIFSLKEVRESPMLQEKFNSLFSSYAEGLKENQKSFMKTYGTEEV